jgi:hypothetical protein
MRPSKGGSVLAATCRAKPRPFVPNRQGKKSQTSLETKEALRPRHHQGSVLALAEVGGVERWPCGVRGWHNQIDASAILGRDSAVQIYVFADELGGHFRPQAHRCPAGPYPIHAAEARFVNEHDTQASSAHRSSPTGLPHSISPWFALTGCPPPSHRTSLGT